jgi:hypothetical protein
MAPDLPSHPTDPPEHRAVVPARTRERAVRLLSAHFAEDNISLDELERRLDLVYAASTTAQLDALTSDLPALTRTREPPAQVDSSAVVETGVNLDPTARVPDSDFMLAVMGGVERKGAWIPPRRMTVATVMGGAELDFRDATFGAELTDVWVVTIMGGVEIIVPPGVRTEVKGLPIMGGFGSSAPSAGLPPGAPTIRIRGLALMGGLEVKVRLPGESEKDARKRLRAERKARQLQRGSTGSD